MCVCSNQCRFAVTLTPNARQALTGGARNSIEGPGKFETAHCPLTGLTNNNETGNNKA